MHGYCPEAFRFAVQDLLKEKNPGAKCSVLLSDPFFQLSTKAASSLCAIILLTEL